MKNLFLAATALLFAGCTVFEQPVASTADSGGNGVLLGNGTLKKDFVLYSLPQFNRVQNGDPILIGKKKDFAPSGESGNGTLTGGTITGGRKQDYCLAPNRMSDNGRTGVSTATKKNDFRPLYGSGDLLNLLISGNHG